MNRPAMKAADRPVRRPDLDFIDSEIAELTKGVEQLQADVSRDQHLGHPLAHSLKLLDGGRKRLEELLRRRTTMFFAFVTGR